MFSSVIVKHFVLLYFFLFCFYCSFLFTVFNYTERMYYYVGKIAAKALFLRRRVREKTTETTENTLSREKCSLKGLFTDFTLGTVTSSGRGFTLLLLPLRIDPKWYGRTEWDIKTARRVKIWIINGSNTDPEQWRNKLSEMSK